MGACKRLILHVGLPKTGTTALQNWCAANRDALKQRGVDYPEADALYSKHQFLVAALMTGDLTQLRRAITESSCDRILLSTEGLSNHLYDFPSASGIEFRSLTRDIEVTVFLVLRNPAAWARSNYKQALTNPVMEKFGYGLSVGIEEWCSLDHIRRLMNFDQLKIDIAAWYGAAQMVAPHYEADWLGDFAALIDIDTPILSRDNSSISDELAELVREVNSLGLSHDERECVLAGLQMCFDIRKPRLQDLARRFGQETSKAAVNQIGLRIRHTSLARQLFAWSERATTVA